MASDACALCACRGNLCQRPLHLGLLWLDIASGHTGEALNHREEIIEIVGNPARHTTQTFHLARRDQLLFQQLAIGDITYQC